MESNKAIVIYGAGAHGIRFYYELKFQGLSAICFVDREKKKAGYLFEGVYCISKEDFLNSPYVLDEIVVALEKPESVIRDFRQLGMDAISEVEFRERHCLPEVPFNYLPEKKIDDFLTLQKIHDGICKTILYGSFVDTQHEEVNEILLDYLRRKA